MPQDSLYNALNKAGYYTKSIEDFRSQFSTPEAQEKLYGALKGNGYYTKSLGDFQTQFFGGGPQEPPVDTDNTTLEVQGSQEDKFAPKTTPFLDLHKEQLKQYEENSKKNAANSGLLDEYVAKQSTIQPPLEGTQAGVDSYFAQKALDAEVERQEKIDKNAETLGLDPKALRIIMDINKSVLPETGEPKEQKEDYLLGTVANFNEGVAELFRTVHRGAELFADATGFEWKNPIFSDIAGALSSVGAEGYYKVPENIPGQILGGIGSIAPDLMATYMMPSMKLTQLGRITGGAIKSVPKFPVLLGVKEGLHAYEQSGESADKYTNLYVGLAHGFQEGLMYEAFGLTGKEAGKLAEAITGSAITRETVAGLASGTLFGGHSIVADPRLWETGEVNWDDAWTNFGIGLAFHGKQIGKEAMNLAKVNGSLKRRAHTAFWTSNRDLVRTAMSTPKSQFELRKESQKLWEQAMSAETPAERQQYLMAKNGVDNIIATKAYAIILAQNSKAAKEAITGSEMSDVIRKDMLRRVDETVADYKLITESAKEGKEIAPEIKTIEVPTEEGKLETSKAKPEEKLSETAKKTKLEEKKLTETKKKKTDKEVVEVSEQDKSLQKLEPTKGDGEQKLKQIGENRKKITDEFEVKKKKVQEGEVIPEMEFVPDSKLKGKKVRMEYEVRETGEKGTKEFSAREIHRDIRRRENIWKKLKNCLG